MRLGVVGSVAVLALVCAAGVGGAGEVVAPAAAKAAPASGAPKFLVNGKPAEGQVLVVEGVPLVSVESAVAVVPAAAPGVTVEKTAAGEIALTRPQAIVRVKPGAKQMRVDGQSVALPTPVVTHEGRSYVPAEVLQALYPDYRLALGYRAATNTVILAFRPKMPAGRTGPPMAGFPGAMTGPRAAAPAGPAACAPSGSGQGVATQEFGQKGAKVEIVAALPITHRCHVRTEAELKKAFEAHPKDIHLIIYDLFGPEGQQFVAQHGGQRAVVFVNGKTSFDLGGRKVALEMQEGGRYRPDDIVPIVEQEIGAK
jgi:hypothetical protein